VAQADAALCSGKIASTSAPFLPVPDLDGQMASFAYATGIQISLPVKYIAVIGK